MRIPLRIHLRVRAVDASVLVDHVADALRVFVVRGGGGAVSEADLALRVAEEREGEAELLGELGVVFDRVEGDAEDLGVLRFVLLLQVPEPGTFQRSARGVGLREEPEHDLLAAVVAQLHIAAVVVFDLEIGSGIAGLEHSFSSELEAQDAAE